MLKIKDNVDLKELEKYGFEKANEPNKHVIYIKKYSKKQVGRIITNLIYFYDDKEMYFEIDEYDDNIVNNLYDLIKADLVEKVGE